MRTLNVLIGGANTKQREMLYLPATYEEIADFADQINIDPTKCTIYNCGNDYYGYLFGKDEMSEETSNIHELNHLSTIIKKMSDYEIEKFRGAVSLRSRTSPQSLPNIINLAMNSIQCENILNYPAADETELGKFFIDKNLLCDIREELAEIDKDNFKWIKEHLDAEAIGKDVCEKEQGIFEADCYTIITDEIEQIYDGKFPVLAPADYVIKLGIAKASVGDEPNDQNLIELKLPQDIEEIHRIIKSTGANSLADCVYYEFDTIAPKLEFLPIIMEEIESLNNLAVSIQQIKDNGDLPKYKAMLDTLREINIENAMLTCEYLHEFTFAPDIATEVDYGRKLLSDMSATNELYNYVDIARFGRAMVYEHGASITPYGLIKSNDGMRLTEKIEQTQQSQDFEMKMQ